MRDISRILFIGMTAMCAVLLLFRFDAYVAGIFAVILVATVMVGFSLQPKTEIFYVQTSRTFRKISGSQVRQKDLFAVKVELVRLWALFLPTALAVGFLVVTSANGLLWKLNFVSWVLDSDHGIWVIFVREIAVVIFLMLQTWVGERWALRNAEASSAASYTSGQMHVTYTFYDRTGELYGGEGFRLDLVRPMRLAKIVFYNPQKPDANKIAMAFLFHRPVIVAHGLPDLNRQTTEAQRSMAEFAPRPLAPDEI